MLKREIKDSESETGIKRKKGRGTQRQGGSGGGGGGGGPVAHVYVRCTFFPPERESALTAG